MAGVGFLLVDLGYWSFLGLSGWTVLFVLLGLGTLCMSLCKGCCDSNGWGKECCEEKHEEPKPAEPVFVAPAEPAPAAETPVKSAKAKKKQ